MTLRKRRHARRLTWLISGAAALAIGASSFALDAFAQGRAPQDVRHPWTEARNAYRNQQWSEARALTAIASQRDPQEARYYLSLGRIAFQQGQFDDAVWFYDTFLDLARISGATYEDAYSVSRAQAERASAAARRAQPTAPVVEPEAQRRVREAFLARMREGAIVTDTGGGALSTFESLIQLGYANPDLKQLRDTLTAAAHTEADRILQSNDGRMPHLTYEAWQAQLRRYEAASVLLPPAVPFEGGAPTAAEPNSNVALRRLVEGQLHYLMQNWSSAEAKFRDAIRLDPTLIYAHHGLLNTLLAHQAKDATAIRAALNAFETQFPRHATLAIYQALAEGAGGDISQAAELLHATIRTAR